MAGLLVVLFFASCYLVFRNKFTRISTWITDNNLSLAAVSKTWHSASDNPNLIACTPGDYCCVDRARPRWTESTNDLSSNHGGVCLFHHRSVHMRSIQLPSYDCFQFIGMHAPCFRSNQLVIVRAQKTLLTPISFFVDFADLLKRVAAHASPLLIVGDLNVRLDVKTGSLV